MVVGFAGAGNMADAIMDGILRTGTHPAQDTIVFDISKEKRSVFQQKGLRTAASISEVAKGADIIFFVVEPQNFAEVLEETRKTITE